MMTTKPYHVRPRRYRMTKGNLSMLRTMSSLLEEYARETGAKKVTENEMLAFFKSEGFTIVKEQ